MINAWLALREDAHALVRTAVRWDEETQGSYTGPLTPRQRKVFGAIHDLDNTQKLFRVDRIGARNWIVWTVYFDTNLAVVKTELDQLALDYPNRFVIVGAWRWDGTQLNDYPPHARILELMPDIVTYDEDGNETSRTRPTVATDVNLLFGQSPRVF